MPRASEWPPRSVKKSASKGIACGGSTRLAASRSFASVVVARLFLRLGHIRGGKFDQLQALAVDLAGRELRQAFDELEPRRHHIGGQTLPQLIAQNLRLEFRVEARARRRRRAARCRCRCARRRRLARRRRAQRACFRSRPVRRGNPRTFTWSSMRPRKPMSPFASILTASPDRYKKGPATPAQRNWRRKNRD